MTRAFSHQAAWLEAIDAILLTHAHRDAAGGMAQLRQWWLGRSRPPIPVYAHPQAIERVQSRHRRLEHCTFHPVEPGRIQQIAGWLTHGVEVPSGAACHHTSNSRTPSRASAPAQPPACDGLQISIPPPIEPR